MAERSAWNWLLGTPDADPTAEWRVRFLAAPPLWVTLLVVVPAILLFVAWLYRRSGAPTAGRRRRFAMAAARALALLLLVLMLYDPILTVERLVTRQSTVAVLLDDSLSMSLKDRYADAKRPEAAREARERLARAAGFLGPNERLTPAAEERLAGATRLELALAAIRTAGPAFLGRLGETHKVKVYAFSSRLAREPDLAKLVPSGAHTKLGDAILEALGDLRGELVAGVVVLTDGRSNAGEKGPIEAAREAAGRDSGVPIHAVGVGSSELPRDIVLSQVQAPDLILKDDQWEVEYTLTHQGYGGERVQVSIRRDSPEGPEVAASEVTLREDGEPQREKILTRRFEQPGDYVLHLVVPVQPDETTPENNQAVLRLRVLDEKLRVLYVDGEPRYEYRHLSQALIRDEKLKANVLLASADTGWPQRRSLSGGVPELQRFPETERDLFQFDALILGDVDPLSSQGLFTRPEGEGSQLAMIEKFVKDLGGGLIFSAGPQANPARYAGTPLEALLPVTLLPDRQTPAGGEDAEVFPERTQEGRHHAVLSLDADRGRNERLWSDPQYRLTGFWRTEPVGREKPSAEVFLRHPTAHPPGSDEGRPILASMRYGLGRTVFVGTDETWRWRLLQGDRLYYRFWQNLIRYVGHNRLLGEQKRFHIALDKTAYTLGERVVVRARVFQESFEPLRDEEVEARLEKPRSGGVAEPLALRAVDRERRPGVYEGSVVAGTLGPHQVWFPLRGPSGEESHAGLASFEVTVPQREFERPSMDRDTLASMARESGGAAWDLWQLAEIPPKVKPLRQTLSGVESVHRLWDSWGVFGLLVVLLCLEWIARKMARLP